MGGILRRDPDVVSAELDGEPRLLHLRGWAYLVLDPVGERIWALLADPLDEEGLVQALLCEFEGDEATIRAEVGAFLREMRRRGFLIEGKA
jgi:hypothetical protein